MAVSLVLPVVSSVARKAAGELVGTVTRMWGVDADRDKLERRLMAVQRLLADAEVKSETDPAVRRWMKDLKAAAYRADDVLDHFQYESLRRQVQGHHSMTSKVLMHFTRENPLLFRLKVSRKLKVVLREIDDLVEEMNNFHLDAEVPRVPLYRQTHSSLDGSEEIYGRNDDKTVVVELLLNQQHQQNVQVLPIIGMGGLGKTTLARIVYNDAEIQKHFELKVWHCVSDNFEAPSVVRSVIECVTKDGCNMSENIEPLRKKLADVIGQKRFLLILDDVWNEDRYKWEDHLKPLLCSSIGGQGSMIVVTSRSQKVASIMGTLPPHELACLGEDDSWGLFSKKAFSKAGHKKEEFITIGRRIVNKCKGLPLALKTMGCLVSTQQLVSEWITIADSNISDTRRGKDDILSILKLSYNYLSPEMKQCFAFCAIFPKDYKMEKDLLIQLWIANNFIQGERNMDLTRKAELIFNELVWRSFLQDAKESARTYGYMRIVCKMHDLMHDLAKDVTEECASEEELTREKISVKDVYHIGLSRVELTKIKGLPKKASYLRTLLVESRFIDLGMLKLKSLRALCCTESSLSLVKYSKFLQYLDLSGSEIIRLPDSICTIYSLQSLRLNFCYQLKYLPDGMATSLRMLRHIYLLGCWLLKEMPSNLSVLQNLHTLTTFVVSTKDGCGIEELKDLQQLSNRLEIYELKKVKSGSKANLHEKYNLCELLLNWNHKKTDYLTNEYITNDEEILESLIPPRGLKVLEVHKYYGLQVSRWMRDPQMFQCLQKLNISNCPRCKDIPLVWLSSSLENLSLSNMDSLTTLCKSIDVKVAGFNKFSQVFPRLKSMVLYGLPNLETWIEGPHIMVMFPQLEVLEVVGCQKLRTLPESPLLTRLSCHIYDCVIHPYSYQPLTIHLAAWPSLVQLDVGLLVNVDVSVEGQHGQSPNILESLQYLDTIGDDAFTSIFNITKLKQGLGDCLAHVQELKISCLCNMVYWPMEELSFLPHLRSLCIWECKMLGMEVLSSKEVLVLPLLKELRIVYCEHLLKIPQLPPSLETLQIFQCGRLVELPSNLKILVKLRALTLSDCRALKALPDGMDGLTSLQDLNVESCPGIEEFPQGLLQRLPTVNFLKIQNCPNLERRCREGGEYFNLVSSILETDIEAVELEAEKVERLHPLCRGDSQLSCLRFWD